MGSGMQGILNFVFSCDQINIYQDYKNVFRVYIKL
jgi:hypothetical protein